MMQIIKENYENIQFMYNVISDCVILTCFNLFLFTRMFQADGRGG